MHRLQLSEIGFVFVLEMELLVQIVDRYKDSKLDVLTFNQVYKLIVWQQPEIFKTKCCVDALCLITTSDFATEIYAWITLQSQYPRMVAEDLTPWPAKGKTDNAGWYRSIYPLYKFLHSMYLHTWALILSEVWMTRLLSSFATESSFQIHKVNSIFRWQGHGQVTSSRLLWKSLFLASLQVPSRSWRCVPFTCQQWKAQSADSTGRLCLQWLSLWLHMGSGPWHGVKLLGSHRAPWADWRTDTSLPSNVLT